VLPPSHCIPVLSSTGLTSGDPGWPVVETAMSDPSPKEIRVQEISNFTWRTRGSVMLEIVLRFLLWTSLENIYIYWDWGERMFNCLNKYGRGRHKDYNKC
jgi:hypothetical protein